MTFDELGNAQYISLETFKKSGEGVKTPVWVTAEGGTLSVFTEGSSWKVKRIRNNDHVMMTPCDARGNFEPDSPWVAGQARILTDDKTDQQMRKRLARKYGLVYRGFMLMRKFSRRKTDSVVIEINPAV